MVHSVSGWTRGVQVKLWDPLRTRGTPELLGGVFTTRRYTNPRLPLPLPYLHFRPKPKPIVDRIPGPRAAHCGKTHQYTCPVQTHSQNQTAAIHADTMPQPFQPPPPAVKAGHGHLVCVTMSHSRTTPKPKPKVYRMWDGYFRPKPFSCTNVTQDLTLNTHCRQTIHIIQLSSFAYINSRLFRSYSPDWVFFD